MEFRIQNYEVKGKPGDWVVHRMGFKQKGEEKGVEYPLASFFFPRLYQVISFLLDAQLADEGKTSLRELKGLIHLYAKDLKAIVDKLEGIKK